MSAPMPTLDERIEAAAKAIFDADNGLDGDRVGTMIHENFRIDPIGGDLGMGDTLVVCRAAAHAALRAAFPELFTSPPTHWLAPWEATEKMETIAGDEFDWGPPGYDNAPRGPAFPDSVFAAMRDSYLSEKT